MGWSSASCPVFAESGLSHLYGKAAVSLRKNRKISIMVPVPSSQKVWLSGSKEGLNDLCGLCLRAALCGARRLASFAVLEEWVVMDLDWSICCPDVENKPWCISRLMGGSLCASRLWTAVWGPGTCSLVLTLLRDKALAEEWRP